jgi:hypothetical protein
MPHDDLYVQHIAATAIVLLAFATWRAAIVWSGRPRDIVGNGITIGDAKAFDNRSLALRIERLSAGLAKLKVIDQKFTENAAGVQAQTSTDSTQSLSLTVKNRPGAKSTSDAPLKGGTATVEAAKADAKPAVGVGASDLLSDQLSLASQILNLQVVYERALTDRLIDGSTRLQTVLGFQVSIVPPAGSENCVAVVEIAVRVKGNDVPVSLVAMIPQERTYNSQVVSRRAHSIEGSAVAEVVTLGAGLKGESRALFIHRDSDTVAFERDPRAEPRLFGNDSASAVFGWEFRPVLGRKTVTAGARQMLAVIALPVAEIPDPSGETIEIRRRSYWRRYNRTTQTSRQHWGLLPFHTDLSQRNDSVTTELFIPNTAQIQHSLAPTITEISWVNSGADRATVSVTGSNFFSGTNVVIGGVVHSEENGNLVLKSDQVLEFETSIVSLASADAVLSGRFGESLLLAVPEAKRPQTVYISRAKIEAFQVTRHFRISIDVRAWEDGVPHSITIDDLRKLPDPLLFIGNELVELPYDYTDQPDVPPAKPGEAGSDLEKWVRFEAWTPAKALAQNPWVSFRVPFCGSDYQASEPLSFSEPIVTRMGGDKEKTIFRILDPVGVARSLSVFLDRLYDRPPELKHMTKMDYRLEIPTTIVQQYQNMIVRIGAAEQYFIPVPQEGAKKATATIHRASKPPQIAKDSLGPVEWSGTLLDAVASAALIAGAVSFPAHFIVSNNGQRISAYFKDGSTAGIGRAEVEFTTKDGETLRAPLFITK